MSVFSVLSWSKIKFPLNYLHLQTINNMNLPLESDLSEEFTSCVSDIESYHPSDQESDCAS